MTDDKQDSEADLRQRILQGDVDALSSGWGRGLVANTLAENIRYARAEAEASGDDPDGAAQWAIDNYEPDMLGEVLSDAVRIMKMPDAARDEVAREIGEYRAYVDAMIERQARNATNIDHQNSYHEEWTERFWDTFRETYGEDAFREAFTRAYRQTPEDSGYLWSAQRPVDTWPERWSAALREWAEETGF